MTPLEITLAVATVALGVTLQWAARVALRLNASAKEGWASASFWQQEAGRNATDAGKWRIHIAACKRGGQTAAQRQKAPILAMAERLRGE